MAIASFASAQFGNLGHSAPTTPEQQAAIDKAVEFLEYTGENLSGINVTNANLAGNIPAGSSGDGSQIGVDFARLEEIVSPQTPGAPGHPGCLVILIFHELQHVNHGWGGDFCSEAAVIAYTAQKHCEFICWILANGGGPVDALCQQYQHVKALNNDPTYQATLAAKGCTVGPSGSHTIPDCECCP